MAKELKTNKYSDAILESWDDFVVTDLSINQETSKPQLRFHWRFNNYYGSGEIDYDNNFRLRNVFGDNYSHLSLSSDCRRVKAGIKPTDSLYDDLDLAIVFQRILDDYFRQ